MTGAAAGAAAGDGSGAESGPGAGAPGKATTGAGAGAAAGVLRLAEDTGRLWGLYPSLSCNKLYAHPVELPTYTLRKHITSHINPMYTS